jgi:hypothetical protein
MNVLPIFDQSDAREALKKRCRAKGVPINTLLDLVKVEIEMMGKAKKKGIYEKFDEILDEADAS